MSVNAWLLGLIVAMGSVIGCKLAQVNEVDAVVIFFAAMNGFGAWLVVTVSKSLIAVLRGGNIRFY